MPDREKIINELVEHIESALDVDSDFVYCVRTDLLQYTVALLKEQAAQKFFVDESGKITPLPVVVRCKDCKHRGNSKKCIVAFVAYKQEFPIFFYDNRGDWFCADGERK